MANKSLNSLEYLEKYLEKNKKRFMNG